MDRIYIPLFSETEQTAQQARRLHIVLSACHYPAVDFPENISIQQCDDQFNNSIVTHGESLTNCLEREKCREIFKEFIPTVVVEKKEMEEVIPTVLVTPVTSSIAYKTIIRDLIKVTKHLGDNGFACSFNMDYTYLDYTDEDNINCRIIIYQFCEIARNEEDQWVELKRFIERVNIVVGVDQILTLKMDELKHHVTNRNRNLNKLFEIPFFWNSSDRIDFIVNLCTFLQQNRGLRFWDEQMENAFGRDWIQTACDYTLLSELLHRQFKDRKQKGIQDLHRGNNENAIRHYITFMRDSFVHFRRMITRVREGKYFPIHNVEHLQHLFQYAYPNHIQILFNRASSLNILVDLV